MLLEQVQLGKMAVENAVEEAVRAEEEATEELAKAAADACAEVANFRVALRVRDEACAELRGDRATMLNTAEEVGKKEVKIQ